MRVQFFAATAIGKFGNSKAVDQLIKLAEKNNDEDN